MSGPERLDWPALMRAGMAGLRLQPRDFWRLTPAELRLMLGEMPGRTPAIGRRRLEELLATFPDAGAGNRGEQGPPEGDGHDDGVD